MDWWTRDRGSTADGLGQGSAGRMLHPHQSNSLTNRRNASTSISLTTLLPRSLPASVSSHKTPSNKVWLETNIRYSGLKAGFYGGSLGLAALFFASGIPRIQTDILMVRLTPTSTTRFPISDIHNRRSPA